MNPLLPSGKVFPREEEAKYYSITNIFQILNKLKVLDLTISHNIAGNGDQLTFYYFNENKIKAGIVLGCQGDN